MEIKWEEIDLAGGKKRYLVTTGEFVKHATPDEAPVCSGLCGSFEASVDTEKYKNICVTKLEFECYELQEQTFKEFFQKMKLPIFFKPHELESGKIRCLEKMGAKQVEDTEGVTIWWSGDRQVWKFEG